MTPNPSDPVTALCSCSAAPPGAKDSFSLDTSARSSRPLLAAGPEGPATPGSSRRPSRATWSSNGLIEPSPGPVARLGQARAHRGEPAEQRRVVADDGLVAHGARRDEAEGDADQLLQPLEIAPGLGGQIALVLGVARGR